MTYDPKVAAEAIEALKWGERRPPAQICATVAALKPEPGKLYVLTLHDSSSYRNFAEPRRILSGWWTDNYPDCTLLILTDAHKFAEADDAMLMELGLTRIMAVPTN